MSCAPTLKSTSLHIFIVHSWLGVTRTHPRWFFKNFVFETTASSKLPEEFLADFLFILGRDVFTVSVTDSRPKSRDHSILLFETEKLMLLYCRLEMYKVRTEMSFWLTVSNNGESARKYNKCNHFCLFCRRFGCASL